MSHSHSSLLDFPPFSHPQLLTSLLLPSCGDQQPPDPRTTGLLGRLATQSPLTSYEPNAIVEISSTEVSPIHRPSEERDRFFAQYAVPVETSPPHLWLRTTHRKAGFTAARAEERSKCSFCKDLSLLISHSERRESCCNTLKRKSSRDTRSVQETHLTSETEHELNNKKLEMSYNAEKMKQS